MKKYLYMAVAAIAALSSCSSDNDTISGENGKKEVNAPVFTATIEGEGTRTALVEGSTAGKLTKVKWLDTDKVYIGGFTLREDEVAGTVVEKTIVLGEYSVAPGSDATTATLNPGSSLLYTAEGTPKQIIGVYPASISYHVVNNTTSQSISSSTSKQIRNYALKITLPATQTYAGSDISKIAPMMANTQTGGNLEFKNITALLAITVPSSEMSSVQKITITSGNRLNGEVTLNDDFSLNYGIGTATDAEKTLTLDCTNNSANTTISAGESKTFYVSIPPQTYGYLQFDVTDGTNTKTMKTKAGANISVERNKIYPIAFEENQTPKLKIKVTSSDITELKAIKVVTDKNIDGDKNYKELVFSSVQTLTADGTVYSINIPEQTYGFYQIYLSADGTTYKEAMASTTAVGTISGPVNIDYEKNAVQLWADGPYFATMNVGETTVGGNTVKYAWGATSADGAPNAKTDNDADTYDDDHDTAYKIWGSAWRMPTKADFEAMSSNCTLGYSSGTFTFTGNTTGYSSAKVSFPKDSNQIIAQYWTSTVNEGGNVYYGSFQLNPNGNPLFDYIGGNKPIDTNKNVLKYFVRAVLR